MDEAVRQRKISYRQVLKATSFFGGVQVLNILMSILKNKVIAYLIGASGLGIVGLITSSLGLVISVTNFGLDRSAVKDISQTRIAANPQNVNKTVAITRKLIWFTAIFGAIAMVVSSSFLSTLTFGTNTYTVSFAWLGIALFFKQLTSGKTALLQGFRELKGLAKVNLLGSFLALTVTIPLYYYFKKEAIVPSIIINAFIVFVVAKYFENKLKLDSLKISFKESFLQGLPMIKLGVMLSISGVVTLAGGYVLQLYIRYKGGVEAVGMYNAGLIVLNTYVGVIFNAMAVDYFPRLSAISNDLGKIKKTVLEQAHVAILIIFPIVIGFMIFAPFLVPILYTPDFLPITDFLVWGILGMLFKTVSWSMGYVIIAKGDSNLFLKTTLFFNAILLTMNVFGYYYAGLEGLGISFFVYYIIHFFSIKVILKYRYQFDFQNRFYSLFVFCILFCVLTFCVLRYTNGLYSNISVFVLSVFSVVFSIFKLDQLMDFKKMIKKKIEG